jgi:hypothetical protein
MTKAKTKGAKKTQKKASQQFAATAAAVGATAGNGLRHPCGKLVHHNPTPPGVLRRLRILGGWKSEAEMQEAIEGGVKLPISKIAAHDAIYGSEVRRMLRAREISEEGADACAWFAQARSDYDRTLGGPKGDGGAWAVLEGTRKGRGADADPEADKRAVEAWLRIEAALDEVNPATRNVLAQTIVNDVPVRPDRRQLWERGVNRLQELRTTGR